MGMGQPATGLAKAPWILSPSTGFVEGIKETIAILQPELVPFSLSVMAPMAAYSVLSAFLGLIPVIGALVSLVLVLPLLVISPVMWIPMMRAVAQMANGERIDWVGAFWRKSG